MGRAESIFKTNFLFEEPTLAARMESAFGKPADPVELVEERTRALFPGKEVIVWEGDPQTFQFTYVSPAAEDVLGYPCALWLTDPNFWTGTVVHPEDRNDAVAFCALATARGENHDFRYRARAVDGRTVVLHDVVHVLKSPRGIASRLRGVMVAVESDEQPGPALLPKNA